MSSTGSRVRRRYAVRDAKFLRIIPMERNVDGELIDSPHVSIIDCKVEDIYVARVPVTTSIGSAAKIEQDLSKLFQKNVLVMTRNVELCRVEEVSANEVATMLAKEQGDVSSEARAIEAGLLREGGKEAEGEEGGDAADGAAADPAKDA